MEINKKLSPYLPGLLLFVFALIISLVTYKDYGMGWDEPGQRDPGVLSFNYIYHGSQQLFLSPSDNHGAGYELLLVFIEKGLRLKDYKTIFEMRHIVTNVFFLLSALSCYVLILRLFKDKWLASLGFIMLVLTPRIYGHSFINSKDMPFLCMVIITFTLCQIAFEKNNKWLFLLLGIACGYATSIRIMGVMYATFIIAFLVIDMIADMKRKEKPTKQLINMALFSVGFCFLLYIAWPYIWKTPFKTFGESFSKMSHFAWKGAVLFQGEIIPAGKIPAMYFPTWFMISNPPLWLLIGFVGIVWVIVDFFKKPITFFQNTVDRNWLLFLASFFIPIFAVIVLHSIIYDDWRHLYFVYPAFVLLGIYGIHKLWKGKIKIAIQVACGIQILLVLAFMFTNHPFHYVYFNSLVSHDDEYLRKNYELEYWGTSNKQALEYLLANDTSRAIKVCATYKEPLENNIMMLPADQRKRFVWINEATQGDYFITNFRLHPDDYPSNNIEYDIKVLNSTILCIYGMHSKKVNQILR